MLLVLHVPAHGLGGAELFAALQALQLHTHLRSKDRHDTLLRRVGTRDIRSRLVNTNTIRRTCKTAESLFVGMNKIKDITTVTCTESCLSPTVTVSTLCPTVTVPLLTIKNHLNTALS